MAHSLGPLTNVLTPPSFELANPLSADTKYQSCVATIFRTMFKANSDHIHYTSGSPTANSSSHCPPQDRSVPFSIRDMTAKAKPTTLVTTFSPLMLKFTA